MSAESYETFDIRDRDTHEYIRNLTREQLAQYVLGELEPYKSSKTNSKFEPLRDEIHHIIHCADGTVYYDSVPISQLKKAEFVKVVETLFEDLKTDRITLSDAYRQLASLGYMETEYRYNEETRYGHRHFILKNSHEGFFIRIDWHLGKMLTAKMYGMSWGDRTNTYEFRKTDV